MRQAVFFVVFALITLVSCVPIASENGTSLNEGSMRSVATLRDGDEIIITWGISSEASNYTTWIEFSKENVDGYVIGVRQQHDEAAVVSEEEVMFSDSFLLSDVASYSREGEKELYTLLLRVAIQAGEGSPIYSRLHRVTFFTTTVDESEK